MTDYKAKFRIGQTGAELEIVQGGGLLLGTPDPGFF